MIISAPTSGTYKGTLAQRRKQWSLETISKRSKVAPYIAAYERVDKHGALKCLFIADDALRKDILLWRCRALGFNRPCPQGHTFRFSCVARCNLVGVFTRRKPPDCEFFTEIDYLLNKREYEKAGGILKQIWNLIRPPDSPN